MSKLKSEKILEYLEKGQFEELKSILKREVYETSLGVDVKKRRSAMKKYFLGQCDHRPQANYPAENILVNGKKWTCFCDTYCLAITKETLPAEMETFADHRDNEEYFNIEKIIDMDKPYSIEEYVDLNAAFAEIKACGYRYIKKNLDFKSEGASFAFEYKGELYNAALIDKVFSIINDGSQAKLSYTAPKKGVTIETSVGLGLVLPFRPKTEVLNIPIVKIEREEVK